MSWSSWSAKLNVQSIVSQGLEQVSKLKEDVEKQFDQVVTTANAQPPGSTFRASTAAATAQAQAHAVEPPSPAVSAALFGDANAHASLPPPPRSLDSTSRATLLSSLGVIRGSSAVSGAGNVTASAPTSRTSKGSSGPVDFFGSYLPTDSTKPGTTTGRKGVEDKAVLPSAKENTSETNVDEREISDTGEASEDSRNAAPASGSADAMEEKSQLNDERKAQAVGGAAFDTQNSRATGECDDRESTTDEMDTTGQVPTDTITCSVEAGEVAVEDGPLEASCENVEDRDGVPRTQESEQPEHGSHKQKTITVCDDEGDTELPLVQNPLDRNDIVDVVDANADPAATQDAIELLKHQLVQRETQLLSTSGVIQELHDELDKTCQREVAAVEKNRFLQEQLELLRTEVLRLNRVVAQQQQPPTSRDQELVAMQQAIAEKDDKLQALLDEGQALSVKQSQLEQRLRQLRREKNEEEEDKLKLQAQSDTLAIQLQEVTAKQKSADDDMKTLQSELRAAHQNAEQAKHELVDAQADLRRQNDRIAALQANAASLQADNESMRAELEQLQHTSDSHATLSVEKQEMDTTIQYLQQTVHGLEAENARREDMARMEIADLKRKWKDALQRVESLGQSVSDATQPLLRQIHALQEDQRARQDAWKATEQTLLQRIRDAHAERTVLEADKRVQEHQLHDLQTTIEDLHRAVHRHETDAARDKERVAAALHNERQARSQCDAAQIELDELKHKLQEEQHAKQALLARVAMATAVDATAKRDGDAHVLAETTTLVAEMKQLQQREEQLRHDLEWHQKELQRVKAATLSPRMAMHPDRRSFDDDWNGSASGAGAGSPRMTDQNTASQASILQRTLASSVDDSRLSSTSVLGLSQLQQRLRLREGENRLLRQQLHALEHKQKQTSDEIVRLSTRNALLESSGAQFTATQQQLDALKQKQHVLLELFGEKEEQVEELQSEVKELKAFYRKQLDTLAGQQQ